MGNRPSDPAQSGQRLHASQLALEPPEFLIAFDQLVGDLGELLLGLFTFGDVLDVTAHTPNLKHRDS